MPLRLLTIAILVAFAIPANAITLARDGKPTAAIVLPHDFLPVEFYAAVELQYHIKRSTGAVLEIYSDDMPAGSGASVFIGHCKQTAAAGVDASALPGNGYIVRTVGEDLFIAGKDGPGDPLGRDTHAGTLFGVYDLLENRLGVRWLWPGDLGEVVPHRATISLPALNATVEPRLWFKEWRLERPESAPAADVDRYLSEERVWLRRQRFGRSVQPSYGHSFGAYWGRFATTHPEYFNMLPNGVRGPDPLAGMTPVGEWMHMCVSQPGLWDQVVQDWRAKGMPEFLNVCEDDGWACCDCPQCLAWDEQDPENPVPFDQRAAAAKRAFDAGNDEWMLQLGSLSARYAKFWRAVAERAVKLRPDVKVVSYVYDNYRKPPTKPIELGPNVLCGYVPWAPFPYNREVSAKFRQEWSEWSVTGCMLFLRPNYTGDGHNWPAFYARDLGEDLKFALAHSMKGTDFDSLIGQHATQGPTLYTLAFVLNHPTARVDGAIDDFYEAFGPARDSIREYFQHWDRETHRLSTTEVDRIRKAKRKYGGEEILNVGPEIYTPEAIQDAVAILDRAKQEAASDATAIARVQFLADGLEQVRLELDAERAFEHGMDAKDMSLFHAAYAALTAFRKQHAAELPSYVELVDRENRQWRVR